MDRVDQIREARTAAPIGIRIHAGNAGIVVDGERQKLTSLITISTAKLVRLSGAIAATLKSRRLKIQGIAMRNATHCLQASRITI
jgi:hypothetical protein